ncbi:hypothetical protein SUDANB58_00510 [Streptomyces sp. enrichment culture]|uniref:SHOCT domain-containing protein n=1 Tax=Streptomyces sp. enrichment culture TaxID=1795815 RepID=UPI003F55B60A
MQTLASFDGGPGPWILLAPLAPLAPLVRAADVIAGVTSLRRTGRPGPRAPWRTGDGSRPTGDSPLDLLGRRFASGGIDEDEYGRRLSVLDERFGRTGKPGAA